MFLKQILNHVGEEGDDIKLKMRVHAFRPTRALPFQPTCSCSPGHIITTLSR